MPQALPIYDPSPKWDPGLKQWYREEPNGSRSYVFGEHDPNKPPPQELSPETRAYAARQQEKWAPRPELEPEWMRGIRAYIADLRAGKYAGDPEQLYASVAPGIQVAGSERLRALSSDYARRGAAESGFRTAAGERQQLATGARLGKARLAAESQVAARREAARARAGEMEMGLADWAQREKLRDWWQKRRMEEEEGEDIERSRILGIPGTERW